MTEKESLLGQMETSMMANGCLIKELDLEYSNLKMETDMRDSLMTVNTMEREPLPQKMGIGMKEIG